MKTEITQNIGTTETKLYTCPNAKDSTLSRLSITNISDSQITFDIRYYNASENATIHLINNGVLSAGQLYSSVSSANTLVLNANDYIAVLSSIDSSVDALITYKESDV